MDDEPISDPTKSLPTVATPPPAAKDDDHGELDRPVMSAKSFHSLGTALARIRRSGQIIRKSGQRLGILEDPGAEQEPSWRKKKKRNPFPDADMMKQRIREQLTQPEYDVAKYYNSDGRAQAVVKHRLFEPTTLFVIALNSLWISVDTDLNRDSENWVNAPFIFAFMDNFFCAFFFSEIAFRFLAFENKLNCFKDFWFVFDSCLVVMMLLETWVLPLTMLFASSGGAAMGSTGSLRMVRIVRLARMMRLVRLLRACPEIVILAKGMGVAMRSVIFTLALQIVIIYVFAIGFRQATDGTKIGNQDFASVPSSMNTLLVRGTFMDSLADITQRMEAEEPWLLVPFYAFILLSALTLMNMLIGVLCEVVTAVASVEKEALDLAAVMHSMSLVMNKKSYDTDCDGFFSREEFSEMITDPLAARALKQINIDVVNLVDMMDVMFEGDEWRDACEGLTDKKLSFADLMAGVVDLRGTKQATVKDVVELRKFLKKSVLLIQESVQQSTHEMLEKFGKHMHKSLSRQVTRANSRLSQQEENSTRHDVPDPASAASCVNQISKEPSRACSNIATDQEPNLELPRAIDLSSTNKEPIQHKQADFVREEQLLRQLREAIREEHKQLLDVLRCELRVGAQGMGYSQCRAFSVGTGDQTTLETMFQRQPQLEKDAYTEMFTAPVDDSIRLITLPKGATRNSPFRDDCWNRIGPSSR